MTEPVENCLKVIKQNGFCSVQDLGRMSSQHLGFSASGAADEYAFLFANYLLALAQAAFNAEYPSKSKIKPHHQNSAQLEITLGQITFEAAQNCTIAITGADCSVCINDKPVSNWQIHQIKVNDIIRFNQPKTGLHSYLAVAGGIQNKQWLGSHSQTSTEQSLGFNNKPIDRIREGVKIPVCADCCVSHSDIIIDSLLKNQGKQPLAPSHFYNETLLPLTLRFIPRKEWFSLNEMEQKSFCEHLFTISSDSNRMGYRLSEIPSKITTTVSANSTLSKPVTFGTIQLPSNNQPIVLMKERQTIGGYPVLGTVIQTDLFKLSQLRPGNKVQLLPTSLQFAQQQLKSFHLKFQF